MDALNLYNNLSKLPFGKKIFSLFFCLKAPYFGSIKPFFEELKSGRCIVSIKYRRSVRNHLGTIHAIAMCNMAEAAAGTCLEVTRSKNLRWIPKKMEVEYLKKAKSNLRAICNIDSSQLVVGENLVQVEVFDITNERVFLAKITMQISALK